MKRSGWWKVTFAPWKPAARRAGGRPRAAPGGARQRTALDRPPSPRTMQTSTASSTCWSRRAKPASALRVRELYAVFGDDLSLPKVEERIGRALSPYGLSKYINELYAGVFARCYGLRWIGLRYFNVFGPRQDADGPYASVIPAWIGALLRGETAYINGDGTAARDFCHVDNVVQMNLRAAMTDDESALDQAYNVAHGEMTSLAELFDIIRALLGGVSRSCRACARCTESRGAATSCSGRTSERRSACSATSRRCASWTGSSRPWTGTSPSSRRARQGRSPMYRTIIEGETVLEEEPVLPTVAVIGLGYVGLPVAIAFGKERRTIGYDHSKKRVENLKHRVDTTGEVSAAELAEAKRWRPTTDATELAEADFIIVAVPTPINAARQPDLRPLESASETVGRHMKPGAIVVYESTVYLGARKKCACQSSRGARACAGARTSTSATRRSASTRATRSMSFKDSQGRVGRRRGDAGEDRRAVRLGGEGGRIPRAVDQSRRSGQGDREHAARPQYRVRQRARDHLRAARNRDSGGAEGRRHEVELPAVPAGPRRRALHRCGPLLPHPQGRACRLPSRGHSRRAAHQRRHGRAHRAGTSADDPRHATSRARASTCSGSFQGTCPTSATRR